MTDPITREQVERAIDVARADEGGISDALGGWQWDKRAPDYVRVAWGKSSLPDFIAALTRWHAELVAAETPRVARWADDQQPKETLAYRLTPPHDLGEGRTRYWATRGEAIAWGYTIEGGPEPVDDTAPERLRERREALGKDDAWIEHILSALDVGAGPDFGYGRERRIAAEWVSSYTEKSTVTMRAAYAAALSVAEAERAAKPDHLAYADSPVWDDGPLPTPTPERPAPRFKVGDVPQPETWHARLVRLATEAQDTSKSCADAEAAFKTADAERERTRLVRATAREACHAARRALTEATTARAILDAQPAPNPEPTRPEPRYKAGDWVRHGSGMPWQVTEVRDYRDCYAYHGALGGFIEGPEVTLSPALDPALHETARKTVAWLRGGPLGGPPPPGGRDSLPGYGEWNTGPLTSSEWAAQLERLLGDAS